MRRFRSAALVVAVSALTLAVGRPLPHAPGPQAHAANFVVTRQIVGKVVDRNNRPVRGASVTVDAPQGITTSGYFGDFSFPWRTTRRGYNLRAYKASVGSGRVFVNGDPRAPVRSVTIQLR